MTIGDFVEPFGGMTFADFSEELAEAREVAAQNREAVISWPEAATATPPEFPFKFDRHVYGDLATWRERNLG